MQRILQLFSRALRLSLVVGLLCCTAATARAQGGGEPINLNATLTVTLTERPATAVLDEITRKTGIKFAYDPEDIRRLPAVSGEFKKVTVHELLDKCIAGSTFKYAIENNVVLVYDSTVKMRKFTVSGTVRDAGKTVLPGASVILKGGSGQGVSTDEKGQFTFSFSTKTSPAVLEVGFLGMETQQVIITGSAKGLNVTLKEGGTRIDDVVVNGKKICGILTEMSAEMTGIHYLVIGTGINTNVEEFPEEIQSVATSLIKELGEKVNRAELIAACLKYFEEYYEKYIAAGNLAPLKEDYEALLLNRNNKVRVLEPNHEYTGLSLGINEDGELLVEKEDGTVTAVYAGEVSVRGVYGYV